MYNCKFFLVIIVFKDTVSVSNAVHFFKFMIFYSLDALFALYAQPGRCHLATTPIQLIRFSFMNHLEKLLLLDNYIVISIEISF